MNINAMNMCHSRRTEKGSHDPPGVVRQKKEKKKMERVRIEKKTIWFKEKINFFRLIRTIYTDCEWRMHS